MPLSNEAVAELSNFYTQTEGFWDKRTKCEFDIQHELGTKDIFEVPEFEMNKNILLLLGQAISKTEFHGADSIKEDEQIKYLLGIRKPKDQSATYYFQVIDSSHLVWEKKSRFFHFTTARFTPVKNGFSVPKTMTAIFRPNKNLWFHSFFQTNSILDLSSIFKIASDKDIKETLKKDFFLCDNDAIETLITEIDDHIRKKLAIMGKVLVADNKITVAKIMGVAKKHKIELKTEGEKRDKKIIFPTTDPHFREFLDFMCERYFITPFTNESRVATSSRRAKK